MMKKILHGLMMMSAAVVISAGVSSAAADAASIAATACTVDYANQKIDYAGGTNATDTKIYVAKATVTAKTNKKVDPPVTVTTVKNAAATEYDLASKKATIDISSFGVTKDVYLSIWGNVNTDPILVKLPAAATKMKAVVDATDSTVTINDVTDKLNPVEIQGTEFCTTNGKWTEYTKATTTAKTTAVKLTDYAKFGATLRFRVTASVAKKLTTTETTIGQDANGSDIKAFVGDGNFASNEVKAKIAKTANGPKATIDYNTRTVKIPVTSEYRHQGPLAALTAFKAAPAPEGTAKVAVLSVDSLNTAKGAEFDLRTAATDRKPASKITEYVFKAGTTIKSSASDTTKAPSYYDVTRANPITGADLNVTKLVLNSRTMAGTMTVANATADGYQFIVADPQDAAKIADLNKNLPTESARITATVAAGRTAAISVKSGQYVYVRKAANVRTQDWSTPYVFYGVVMNTK